MGKSPVNRFPFAKIVVIFAVAFLVGIGLCGLDYLLAANGIGKSTEEFGVGILDAPSLIIMVLSAACLGLTLIVWMISAIVSSTLSSSDMEDPLKPLNLDEKVSQPEKHHRRADDTNIDKQE